MAAVKKVVVRQLASEVLTKPLGGPEGTNTAAFLPNTGAEAIVARNHPMTTQAASASVLFKDKSGVT
jgi:hypothetical protein